MHIYTLTYLAFNCIVHKGPSSLFHTTFSIHRHIEYHGNLGSHEVPSNVHLTSLQGLCPVDYSSFNCKTKPGGTSGNCLLTHLLQFPDETKVPSVVSASPKASLPSLGQICLVSHLTEQASLDRLPAQCARFYQQAS